VTVADVLLIALGAVALGAGVRVVGTAHLVRAGLWLIVTLAAIAGMYLVLGAELVAWVQVLLYVGAVVVLLLFAVMLTRAPIGMSIDMDRPRLSGALIGGGSGLGLAVLFIGAYHWAFSKRPSIATADNIGTAVFRTWGLPFEVVSMLLLAALVGAIVVSRPVPDEAGDR
jgi:NADH-quinone oxidoreductase subunit J